MTWNPILTPQQASEIKAWAKLGVPLKIIAAKYKVSLSCVKQISSLRTWKHVNPDRKIMELNMKIRFSHDQEIETDGIIGLIQEEAGIVRVKYPGHETRIKGTTTSEVWARINEAKSRNAR